LFNGKRAEHPCYGCELDCDVRLVEYEDPLKRYIIIEPETKIDFQQPVDNYT